jgi:hypothetical protein
MPRTIKQSEKMIEIFASAPGSTRIVRAIEPAMGYMTDEELRGAAEFIRYQAYLRQRQRDIERGVVPTIYEKFDF